MPVLNTHSFLHLRADIYSCGEMSGKWRCRMHAERCRTHSSRVSNKASLACHLSLSKLPWTDLSCHRASLSIIICPFLAGCIEHLHSLSTQRPEKDDTATTMLTQQLCDCWWYIAEVSLTHHRDDFAQIVRESSMLSLEPGGRFHLHDCCPRTHNLSHLLKEHHSNGNQSLQSQKIDKNKIKYTWTVKNKLASISKCRKEIKT